MRTNRYRFGRIIAAGTFFAIVTVGQTDATFDARDMFYSAADMMGGGKKQGSAGTQTSQSQPQHSSGKPKGQGNPPVSRPQPELARSRPVPKDPEAHFQLVSQQQVELPLGLRYSLLKKTPGGLVEVKPDSVFHSGEMIRITVMGNQKGYLYVISRGSSGVWTPLFPHPDSSQKSNEIVAGRKYQIPGGDREYFQFENPAGAEKLFVLLSKKPVDDLDALILSLTPASAPEKTEPAEQTKPAKLPMIEASNRINDEFVAGLRDEVQARDLVFTRTDAEPPAASNEPQEKAVYVVNKNSDPRSNARVVVDLTLNHQ